MSPPEERLYELLPVVYRQRDAERGWPLRALLRVIEEQLDVVDRDIGALYESWFIETCADWVVPYIGDVVGYQPVAGAGAPGDPLQAASRERNRVLMPRREVANTVRYRRRKGTLAVLELLARDAADWPARAVEFCALLAQAASVRLDARRAGPWPPATADLRRGDALDRLDGPFDEIPHGVEVRRIGSQRSQGRYGVPNVGLYVWRLKPYPVTHTSPYCVEEAGRHCFAFSALGNDGPLFVRPRPEAQPTSIAGEGNVPTTIRRRGLAARRDDYYGPGRSFEIFELGRDDGTPARAVPPDRIVVADLEGWRYQPVRGKVAVDPVRGRIAYPPTEPPERLLVDYHYGFGDDLGGGEYPRPLTRSSRDRVYRVGKAGAPFASIREAIATWTAERGGWDPAARVRAVIEIVDSAVYVEPIAIDLGAGQTLELRAAEGARPILRLLDFQTGGPDAMSVTGTAGEGEIGGRFALDGLLVAGRGLSVRGTIGDVGIRHATLVPGWSLEPDCHPRQPAEWSLELFRTRARVDVARSILGSIHVIQDRVGADPVEIALADSILDATHPTLPALSSPGHEIAHAVLTARRTTVFGCVLTHAIELGENAIFDGQVRVARRQRGCMRFCFVPPGSRTPRRYHCPPEAGPRVRDTGVRPQFESVRYGTPAYGRLAPACPEEIRRGAEDQSELGAFHDLYEPQRAATLRARLAEYTPAGMDSGILYAMPHERQP